MATSTPSVAHPDSRQGIVDTACGKTVAGSTWVDDYVRCLTVLGLEGQIVRQQSGQVFRFGDGRDVKASETLLLPAVVCGRATKLNVCVVPGPLPLLIGRDFYEAFKPDISYSRRTMSIGNHQSQLVSSAKKHLALDLKPSAYRMIDREQSSVPSSELPRALRPRSAINRAAKAVSALIACMSGKCVTGQAVPSGGYLRPDGVSLRPKPSLSQGLTSTMPGAISARHGTKVSVWATDAGERQRGRGPMSLPRLSCGSSAVTCCTSCDCP